jgi:hypothetical protein
LRVRCGLCRTVQPSGPPRARGAAPWPWPGAGTAAMRALSRVFGAQLQLLLRNDSGVCSSCTSAGASLWSMVLGRWALQLRSVTITASLPGGGVKSPVRRCSAGTSHVHRLVARLHFASACKAWRYPDSWMTFMPAAPVPSVSGWRLVHVHPVRQRPGQCFTWRPVLCARAEQGLQLAGQSGPHLGVTMVGKTSFGRTLWFRKQESTAEAPNLSARRPVVGVPSGRCRSGVGAYSPEGRAYEVGPLALTITGLLSCHAALAQLPATPTPYQVPLGDVLAPIYRAVDEAGQKASSTSKGAPLTAPSKYLLAQV